MMVRNPFSLPSCRSDCVQQCVVHRASCVCVDLDFQFQFHFQQLQCQSLTLACVSCDQLRPIPSIRASNRTKTKTERDLRLLARGPRHHQDMTSQVACSPLSPPRPSCLRLHRSSECALSASRCSPAMHDSLCAIEIQQHAVYIEPAIAATPPLQCCSAAVLRCCNAAAAVLCLVPEGKRCESHVHRGH